MNNEIRSGVYCIENVITHKKYIGQSVDINNRWYKHKSDLNRGVHDNDYLQKAWNKYGENEFDFYVLEYCNVEELNDKERYYIDFYHSMKRDCGYNLKSGGQDYNYFSSEVKEKISSSNKKYYLEHPEMKQSRSIGALNQWANPKIKEKILGENNSMYGKHHTEESKKKMSETRTGKPIAKRYPNPVICVELNKVFDNSVEAGKALFLDGSAILKVCRGERKICGGYHWEFYNMGNNIC